MSAPEAPRGPARPAARWLEPAVLSVVVILARVHLLDDPLFGLHDFRMNESAAITRNFHEIELNIFHPRIDWGGAGSGLIEEQFQVYTYFVALLYRLFGEHEFLGRGVSLVATVATGLLLRDLVARIGSRAAANFAHLAFALAPLGIYYGAAFQPDATGVLLMTAAVWGMVRHVADGGRGFFVVSLVATALSGLVKPPNLHIGVPLVYLLHTRHGWGLLRRPSLWLFAAGAVLIPLAWYAYARTVLLETGGNTGVGGFRKVGTLDLAENWEYVKHMGTRISRQVVAAPTILLALLGALVRPPGGNRVLVWWFAGFAVAGFATSGVQRNHNYYQLPLTTICAGLAGLGGAWLLDLPARMSASVRWLGRARWLGAAAVAGIFAASVLGARWSLRNSFPTTSPAAAPLTAMARRVRELTPEDALLVIGGCWFDPAVSGPRHHDPDGRPGFADPIELYQSHRKGWFFHVNVLPPSLLQELARKGASYFVSWQLEDLANEPELVRALDEQHELVERTDRWVIYRLRR